VCAIHFAFFYGEAFGTRTEPTRRTLVKNELAQSPGRKLVFVRYWPGHIFQDEWVYNEADIDRAAIVWARDLGPEDEQLRQYFPDRTAWLLEPDAHPPKLSAYRFEPPAPVMAVPTVEATPEKPKPKPLQPLLRFEDVK
jgi:hypothetical protein